MSGRTVAVYAAADVRRAEQPLLQAGAPLMSWAAAAVAEQVRLLRGESSGEVLVLAGSGNNGADALFAAAELAAESVPVRVFRCDSRIHEQAWAAAVAAGAREVTAEQIEPASLSVVVDGILGIGTGADPALRGDARGAVALLRAAEGGYRVLAVDLPSGVHPDTGASDGEVLDADVTVTFGAVKAGTVRGDGAHRSGKLVLVELGLDLSDAVPAGVTRRPVVVIGGDQRA